MSKHCGMVACNSIWPPSPSIQGGRETPEWASISTTPPWGQPFRHKLAGWPLERNARRQTIRVPSIRGSMFPSLTGRLLQTEREEGHPGEGRLWEWDGGDTGEGGAADGAGLEAREAHAAHAQVAARQQHCVLGLRQANHAVLGGGVGAVRLLPVDLLRYVCGA
eukprot:CAMPEP_0181299876 /NCGR_PEP_ID=MMETSP1101-20121128/6585_1 /TAXON_ID=46948 /ORGANISM="Rhodomonas abbreviata, Strain Caron Lab Isolate" /LENGTH=163 /DNA_ID=CAMNT_0023405065 /DNA_START=33 /DNA_END=525 /DNA_ORIENTATION=+